MAMVVIRPSPSPSRGRPGWGWVLLVRWRFERCRGGRETHPHPTLPLKGRAFRRLRGGFELGGPVLLDRKSVAEGKRVCVRVDLGVRRLLKQNNNTTRSNTKNT